MKNQNKPAFYFATNEKKLRYNDGRSIVVGETHSVDGEIEICKNGLHASSRLIDALNYALGNILYLVECSGDMDITEDKFCSRHRKYLAEFDATKVLKEFARKVALINIELIKPYCSEEDYKIILDFLETGNNDVDASRAAWSSATHATWSAAHADAAAWSADVDADDAARAANAADADVARAAAWSARAARSAANAAAASRAVDAAWSADAARTAARVDAATHAAWSAAKDVQNDLLTSMIKEATGWDI